MEKNNEEYVKTGEDKKYDYYRSNSEVYNDDDNAELYSQILRDREEFYVKFNIEKSGKENEIEIKKRSFHRIMILSLCEPEEQVLFSLHKTIKKNKPKDPLKTNDQGLNENKKNTNEDKKPINDNHNVEPNKLIMNNNIVPNRGNEVDTNLPIKVNEGDNFEPLKKEITTKLSTYQEIDKWFYLILVVCGLVNILIFLTYKFDKNIDYNSILLILIGVIASFTGIYGFIKIRNKKYNDIILLISSIVCIGLGITSIITLQDTIKIIYVNIVLILFTIICIILTYKLNKEEIMIKKAQNIHERLIDEGNEN